LTKRGSFDYLYRHGTKANLPVLSLVYLQGKSTKIGFSVSKKIGKAHTRNLVKRRLRAIVASLLPSLQKKAQIVFVTRTGIETLDFETLKKNTVSVLKKAKFL